MDSTVCLVLASVLIAYQTPAEDPLTLSVEVVNAAGVPDRVALAAAEEASRIVSGSRVHLTWIQKPGSESAAPLTVLVTTEEFTTNTHGVRWTPGKAQKAEDQRTVAVSFRLSFMRRSRTGFPRNGYSAVIAHELAHLLLPRGWHDQHGVVRRSWDTTDFQLSRAASWVSVRLPKVFCGASSLERRTNETDHKAMTLPNMNPVNRQEVLIKRSSTLACVVGIVCAAATATLNGADDVNTQTARLYQLQADFHQAASVHDWVNRDTQAVIDARILEMLDLWTPDGVLHLTVDGSNDGFYDYRGDVFTPADVEDVGRCPTVSGAVNTTRGTLCTFFRYVAGSFQLPNRIVSLAPAYKTRFDVHGDTAGVYFECHYFNVAPAAAPAVPWPPRAGLPAWTPTGSQIVANGTAVKRQGDWRFFYLDGSLSTGAYDDGDRLGRRRDGLERQRHNEAVERLTEE